MTSQTPDIIPIPTTFRQHLMTQDQVQMLKEGTLQILETVGVHFPSKRALSIFADHGAGVDHDTMIVRIPPDLVEKAMSSAPRAFTLGGREERFDLYLDGQNSYLCTDGCGVHVVDVETREMRASRKADVALMARISDALPLISFFWPLVSAQDHGRTAPLHECHAGLTNTLKHVRGGMTVPPSLAPYVVEMAMGKQDLYRLDIRRPDRVQDALHVATWIDDGRLTGNVAPEERAVLLKQRNGDDLVLQHGLSHRDSLRERVPIRHGIRRLPDQPSRRIS